MVAGAAEEAVDDVPVAPTVLVPPQTKWLLQAAAAVVTWTSQPLLLPLPVEIEAETVTGPVCDQAPKPPAAVGAAAVGWLLEGGEGAGGSWAIYGGGAYIGGRYVGNDGRFAS